MHTLDLLHKLGFACWHKTPDHNVLVLVALVVIGLAAYNLATDQVSCCHQSLYL